MSVKLPRSSDLVRRLAPVAASVVLAVGLWGCQTSSPSDITGSLGEKAEKTSGNARRDLEASRERYKANTKDADAALKYAKALRATGQKSQAVEMGEMGTYQVFSHDGTDIGGMMGLGNSPVPAWLPYFGANGIDAAIARITKAGGKIAHGPTEVPGGAFIAVAQDPQGAWFAVVGPKDVTS